MKFVNGRYCGKKAVSKALMIWGIIIFTIGLLPVLFGPDYSAFSKEDANGVLGMALLFLIPGGLMFGFGLAKVIRAGKVDPNMLDYNYWKNNSGKVIFAQQCPHCGVLVEYDCDSLDGTRAWYPHGFVYCPQCKTPIRHQANVRPAAQPVEQPILNPTAVCRGPFCTGCGAKLDANAVFCSSCGKKKEI